MAWGVQRQAMGWLMARVVEVGMDTATAMVTGTQGLWLLRRLGRAESDASDAQAQVFHHPARLPISLKIREEARVRPVRVRWKTSSGMGQGFDKVG